MKQRFFKLDSCWYADVPGHTLAENEMVCGADSLLEEMSTSNVTHDVLGEHPMTIYINSVE